MQLGALFIDFNSYFASVEQQLQPHLRGKPVAVLPVMANTTSCIAASYEAKAFGVKTGTRVWEATQRCPDIIFVEAQHAKYVNMHHKLVATIEECAPVSEVRSIDELWCELTGDWQNPDVAIAKAHEIKAAIQNNVGEYLGSSIGIAPNWFLAKIASNMQKPNGLIVLDSSNLKERMFALELSDIYGIGKGTEARMHRHGIYTVEALYKASREELRKVYNSVQGERLYDLLRGRQVYRPPTNRASISHSHVLPPRMRNFPGAQAVLHRLLQKAMVRLRKMDYTCGELGLRIRYHDGNKYKCSTRFSETDDTAFITNALNKLWDKQIAPDKTVPSAVGVVLNRLRPVQESTGDLFNQTARPELNKAVDKLNERYGKNTIYYAGAANALDEAPMRIAFTRIPDVLTEQ